MTTKPFLIGSTAPHSFGGRASFLVLLAAVHFFVAAAVRLGADQVQMQNGDRYFGKVLSMTPATVVLQSEVLGLLSLPRTNLASISFGTNALSLGSPTNLQFNLSPLPNRNPNRDFSAAVQELRANTNKVQQVREQMLVGTGPDANKKFDEMVAGVRSGKLQLDHIRVEADSAAKQIAELKRSLGPDAGGLLDAYLEILNGFLEETALPVESDTNAPPTPVRTRPELGPVQ